MAGEAKTTSFMLGAATVMLGPQEDLFDLTPSVHSIGLVKNFSVNAEPTYLDLTQGMRNTVVFSALTGFPVRGTCEVYEYTGKNLSYALGLDGVGAPTTAAAVTKGSLTDPTKLPTDTPAAWYYVQERSGGYDKVWVGKSGDTIPVSFGFSASAHVRKANAIAIGQKDEQPFFSAKVVGILPRGNVPVVCLFPKVRILKGFTVNFQTENYGNMPYEFTPYELVPDDPHYDIFSSVGPGLLVTPE